MKMLKKWSFWILMLMVSPIMLTGCGSDDDEDEKKKETIVEMTNENLTDDGYFDGLLYYQILSNSPKQAEVKKALKSCQAVKVPDKIKIGNDVYSIVHIGDKAFYECKSLVSIELPNSLTNIGYEAFEGCDGLTSVHISNISAWCKIDFAYYSSNPLSYAHHLYVNNKEVTELVIPNDVTSIKDYAFAGWSSLTSITIPNSVTSIGEEAFSGCSGLTSINIPNSVTSIGGYAFYGCSGLTSITIPNSVTNIGERAIYGCDELTSIVVESGNKKYDSRENCNAIIETASNSLLYGCKNTNIPNSVTSIREWAFSRCSGLTSVTIPNSVTSIGGYAFYGCSGLTAINIPNSVTSIEEGVFSGCSGLTSVTIPNSVTSIGDFAFYNCNGLTSITIPNSVTSIGEYAFYDCNGLRSICCKSITPPRCTSNVFGYSDYNYDNSYFYSNATLYVPVGSLNNYKSIEPWKRFSNIVEENN